MPGPAQASPTFRPGHSFGLADMRIGHINLAASLPETSESFIRLVEVLQRSGMQQHVLVRDPTVARRLATIRGVEVGPVVHAPVLACCLMPAVDIAHAHEPAAGQAGLLLALTRSIPYVLTHRGAVVPGAHAALAKAVYRRAATVVCQDDSELAILRHWLPGLSAEVVPDIDRHNAAASHLRLYQNSQRIPMAGNNGIQ